MATNPEKIILTYEDLIELPNDRQRYEMVDGELYVTAAPNTSHQTAVTNLTTVLNVHVRAHRLGQVFTANVLVDGEYREVAVARESERISADPFPDLVIELGEIWYS